MKKIISIMFLFFFILLLGVFFGTENNQTKADEIKDKIEMFEGQISTPNGIINNEQIDVKPNIGNQVAKKGEKIVYSLLDHVLETIKNILESDK